MDTLKPCACGKTPKQLLISDANQGGKWAYVAGDCCGEWELEFRTSYFPLDSQECMDSAIERWNQAPRLKRTSEWVSVETRLPKINDGAVLGFNPKWIDLDFNIDGIRECFVYSDGTKWMN